MVVYLYVSVVVNVRWRAVCASVDWQCILYLHCILCVIISSTDVEEHSHGSVVVSLRWRAGCESVELPYDEE